MMNERNIQIARELAMLAVVAELRGSPMTWPEKHNVLGQLDAFAEAIRADERELLRAAKPARGPLTVDERIALINKYTIMNDATDSVIHDVEAMHGIVGKEGA